MFVCVRLFHKYFSTKIMTEIEKPWGKEEILEINKRYMFKRLTMKKGHRCSLQYHNTKHETIYVLEGKLNIFIGSSIDNIEAKVFHPNMSVTLEPGIIHRMEALEDCIYLEASTPEIDDVIRLNDDYNRNSTL